MEEFFTFALSHKTEFVALLTAVVAATLAVVKLTPTKKDDRVVELVLELLRGDVTEAKDKEPGGKSESESE